MVGLTSEPTLAPRDFHKVTPASEHNVWEQTALPTSAETMPEPPVLPLDLPGFLRRFVECGR